jgi:hypothetical protein
MADVELFSEDKSAGIYIKLDTYDERDYDDEREFRHGDSRRRGSGAPRNERRGGGRHEKKRGDFAEKGKKPLRSAVGAGSGSGASRKRPARNAWQGGGREKPKRAAAPLDDALLGLSFDERLKHYKEKYQAEGGAETRDTRKSGGARQTAPGKRGFSRGANASRGGKKRGGGTQNARANARHNRPPVEAQQQPKTAARKGFLKKILSIFTK